MKKTFSKHSHRTDNKNYCISWFMGLNTTNQLHLYHSLAASVPCLWSIKKRGKERRVRVGLQDENNSCKPTRNEIDEAILTYENNRTYSQHPLLPSLSFSPKASADWTNTKAQKTELRPPVTGRQPTVSTLQLCEAFDVTWLRPRSTPPPTTSIYSLQSPPYFLPPSPNLYSHTTYPLLLSFLSLY